MQTQTYNGWTNYATWGVSLILDNDEATYNHVRETAEQFKADAPEHTNVPEIWTIEEAAKYELADWLKDYTEELCGLKDEEDTLSLMARQVIQAGLSDVNWHEIAENTLEDS